MKLYHGTHQENLDSILENGLLPSGPEVSKNWPCSKDVVYFSIYQDHARVEATSVGVPINNAVVIAVDLLTQQICEYLGPTGEYWRGPEKGSSVYTHAEVVSPKRIVQVYLYTSYSAEPRTLF